MQTIENIPTELEKMLVSMNIAFKSLFRGRKWLVFTILSLIPLFLTLLIDDKLLGNRNAEYAFVDIFLGFQFFLFFSFGCLILALPISSDEISDHVIDLYLVRPVRREVLWASRWIVLNISLIVVNFGISLVYFLYFHFWDDSADFFSSVIDDAYLLVDAFFFILAASLVYGGLFLLVGFIGRRGFALGVMLAIFELFFLSLLFLSDEPYIPRTNLQVIADKVFDPVYTFDVDKAPDFLFSLGYVGFVAVAIFLIGTYYLSNRQFP
ncbi:MAG: hypothetical protein ACFFCQ_09455 [Promethearchaeota archaeon]